MAEKLIRLDNKHISVEQMTMSVDRVLQCYIRNMPGPPLSLIENYLREAGFWHVATIGRGCKLDLKLISALCIITLEDVHLQLGLPVDGYAVTGSASSTDWGAVCYELLGAIPDNINGGRIKMGWLQDTFPEQDNDLTELERIRYARAYILEMIGGYLMPDLSRNLIQLRWLLKLVDFRAAGKLSWDIRLVLDQQSEAQFQWTPYEDPAIRAVIPDEFFQNPNAWHVKVALVNYATVEMHQSDRGLRQFGFRQPILVAPEVFDDEHKVDLRQLHTDWPRFWSNYIEMWENRYDYIPTKEPIIVPELACVLEYMPWFRIHGKPYLLSKEERRRKIRAQREQRGPLNPRRRDDDAGPSTAPTQSPSPTVQPTTPTSQPFQIKRGVYPSPYMYPNPYMFPFSSFMTCWNVWPSSSPFPITPSQLLIYRMPSHEGSHEAPSGSSSFYQSPSPYGIQIPSPFVMQTPPQSLFYQCGSPSQHPQPNPLPEEPQPPPEADQRRNPARTR
ncbi:hypothetical protein PVK06_007751 [Gossypium arboreum]|uniref:Aminotransferase-like plant mobile domain-containing protein n=1 Tax=Gossypium arboreum TaxID=29729 RepID=A0ABR0QJ49_GOSAR|nr:hypothetical protein PVK06_007751 [Gossypium arboreum]